MIRAIDLFAGCGGFTEGATQAGVDVVWAANHWEQAVEYHARNHPDVQHVCQDLHQADWTRVPSMDLVLASPACQGHSRARGKERPHHDATRSTAWALVSCCEYHRPSRLVVENVEEFRHWALYPAWRQALEALGYHLTETVLDAADAGVPQNRKRLFVAGSLDGPVSIPQPEEPHTAARGIIDWLGGSWSPVHKPGRAERTLRQVAAGVEEFGDEPFLAPYYTSGSGLKGRSLDRPIGTVRTRDAWALIDAGGRRMRMLTPLEYVRAQGFPEGYRFPASKRLAVHMIGNSVPPPLAAHVVRAVTAGL